MSELTNPAQEAIRFYSKQLRLPTFVNYEQVIRQLEPGDGYDQFLLELMKNELNQRQEAGQKRRIKRARFPYNKTLDDFNYERLQHVSKALIYELATCDYISNRQNITMIGNSGAGNYEKILLMERNELTANSGSSCGFISFHNTSK